MFRLRSRAAGRLLLGLGLAVIVSALPTVASSAATEWAIVHDESRLGFEATQQGGRFEGRFEDFSADMRFSADDLAASRFDVTIATGSVNTGSSQRDANLPDAEWFNTDAFPEAYYVTREIRATPNGYEAVGDLTIRDNTHEVVLPFTWRTEGERAEMDGAVTIDRVRFGVGQGEWRDPSVAGHAVEVVVDLTLER
ncbi:YceI family protein [Spiribacter onubensis]|uniref:YceI family protein n=1 Tax=Spiribacter onubensis TaxID=3122420 RepID=A0ABV3SCN1_9GAMM